ncbi:MAG: hypothetical protein A2X83_08100 [Desulfuromonadales bacterium GWD2_54_10]|nr:MAG: hypothetical protein A2X83_08100 [Desulfuromonadales bacterium GWD2_54_10]
MGEWKEFEVSALCRSGLLVIGDGYRAKNSELSATGFPFARAGNIDRGFNFTDADCFPIENLERVGEKTSRPGDTVFTSKGTVGRFAFVRSSTPQFVYSPQLCYWRSLNSDEIDPRFLFYWMQSREFFAQVEAVKGQTDMADYVSLSDQRQMIITLPEGPEQKEIASILSSFDDKIDLLYRQNKTLEALAETLFRQWFVEEAEDGWEEITLSTIADHMKSSINPAKNPHTTFYHYSLPAFDEGQEPKKELGSEILSNKYLVLPKSVLMSKLNPRIPRIWRIDNELVSEFSVASTEFQVVKPKDESWYGVIYCFLKSSKVSQELSNSAGGTSGSHQRVSPDDIFSLTLLRPPDDKVNGFNFATDDFWKKITRNKTEIRTLTRLRDTILSKLMSGEVRLNTV